MSKNIYDNGSYLDSNSSWHEEDAEWKFRHLEPFLSNLKFTTLVDVGCGTGAVLNYIKKSYSDVSFFGFEISQDASSFWKDKDKDIKLKLGSIFDSTKIYDVIIALDVFEHIEDHYTFLRDLNKKGNDFIFHIPLDLFALASIMDNYIHKRKSVGHLHFFDKNTSLAVLEDCGYKVINSKLTKAYQVANTRKARNLKYFRKIAELLLGQNLNARLLGGYSLMVHAKKISTN